VILITTEHAIPNTCDYSVLNGQPVSFPASVAADTSRLRVFVFLLLPSLTQLLVTPQTAASHKTEPTGHCLLYRQPACCTMCLCHSCSSFKLMCLQRTQYVQNYRQHNYCSVYLLNVLTRYFKAAYVGPIFCMMTIYTPC
jgi:hypothetical protein